MREMSVVQIVSDDHFTTGFGGGYDLAVIRSLQVQVRYVAPAVTVRLEKPAHQSGEFMFRRNLKTGQALPRG